MVKYLQHLDMKDHLHTIFIFAKWVTDNDISLGIKVTTIQFSH